MRVQGAGEERVRGKAVAAGEVEERAEGGGRAQHRGVRVEHGR